MKIIPYSNTLTIRSFIQRALDNYLTVNNDTIRVTQPAESKKSLERRVLNAIATQCQRLAQIRTLTQHLLMIVFSSKT